ncbi:unnamed protein product, partial [Didymodactylos carnosus]
MKKVEVVETLLSGIDYKYRYKILSHVYFSFLPADLDQVIQRSFQNGLDKIIATSGTYAETLQSLELCSKYDNLYTTCGYHPTRCQEFAQNDENVLIEKMVDLLKNDKVIAIGELGLDYERQQFCSIDIQKRYFEFQLKNLTSNSMNRKPLFLHNRSSTQDLYEILNRYRENIVGGV